MSDIGRITTYEECLEKYGTLTYRNVGVSMLPLLKQGRDIFTVRKNGIDILTIDSDVTVTYYRIP